MQERIYTEDYRQIAFIEEGVKYHFEGVTAEGLFKYTTNVNIL